MLEMVLLMTAIGTVIIGTVIAAFEWRSLGGYWRLKKQPLGSFPMDKK
jgi:hypothetical protein